MMIDMTATRDDLSRLVRDANDNGFSYQQIADRAGTDVETGERLTKAYVHGLAKTPPANPPREWQLRLLAVGLGVPEAVVKRAAAAQWLGYTPAELSGYDDNVRVIVAHLGDLDSEEVARIRRLVENWKP